MIILYILVILLFVLIVATCIIVLSYFYPSAFNIVSKLLFIIILIPLLTAFVYLLKESYMVEHERDFTSQIKEMDLPVSEIMLFTDDNIMLSVWEIKYHSKAPTVILSHSAKKNKLENLTLANRFYKEGYNCILFDFRAHGESKGKIFTFGHKERKDLKTVIEYFKNNSYYRNKKIGLYGKSFGALMNILVGSKYEVVKAIVADSPYPNVQKYLETYAKLKYKAPSWIVKYPIRISYLIRFFEDPKGISIVDNLKGLSQKSMFYITGRDKKANIAEVTKDLYAQTKGSKKLHIFKRRIEFNGEFRKKSLYLEKVVKFFNKYLPKKSLWKK